MVEQRAQDAPSIARAGTCRGEPFDRMAVTSGLLN
jgi:hypothetical protein